jgi:putative NIF3 family GTP cyclohydrolase 1 type 2
VQRAAICSGSGGGLTGAFLASGADVYISGDIKYHQARDVEDAGRAVIDVGHFASEHLITAPLAMYLEKAAISEGWNVSVKGCRLERDPFAFA